jgi:protein-S-isoprenylcysteine O-methyltransferase Ste14
MFLSIPLALGSLITLLPAIISIFLLITRINNEEKMLLKEFKEYNEYIKKVHYRLIPRIW